MFKNKFDETFKNGDDIWVMTTCSKHTTVEPGKFIGVNANGKVRVTVTHRHAVYTNKETGKVGWDWQASQAGNIVVSFVDSQRATTLQLNRVFKRAV